MIIMIPLGKFRKYNRPYHVLCITTYDPNSSPPSTPLKVDNKKGNIQIVTLQLNQVNIDL